MASFHLQGHRALITGAGRGLGRACALALAEAGIEHVLIVSRTGGELERVAGEISALGADVDAVVADLTDPGDVNGLRSKMGAVDICVHCVGTNVPEPILEVTEPTLDYMLQTNVKSAFLVAQMAARAMVTGRRAGVIVLMSSQMGHVGDRDRSVYCTTKHAIEGLVKAMAIELAPVGVRVLSVAPTFVLTPMTAPFLKSAAFRRDVLSRIPLGRLGRAEEVAAAVLFAVSDAASLITGTSIVIDGGWTAR